MGNGYSSDERRKFARLKVSMAIAYQLNKPSLLKITVEGEDIEAIASDLSEGGMAIVTDYDIPLNSLLSIEFNLCRVDKGSIFNLYKLIELKGEVRSNLLLENKMHRLGICFTELDDESRLEIANFIKDGLKS